MTTRTADSSGESVREHSYEIEGTGGPSSDPSTRTIEIPVRGVPTDNLEAVAEVLDGEHENPFIVDIRHEKTGSGSPSEVMQFDVSPYTGLYHPADGLLFGLRCRTTSFDNLPDGLTLTLVGQSGDEHVISSYELSALLVKFGYKLVEGPPDRIDWDVQASPIQEGHFSVTTVEVANDLFKRSYADDSTVLETTTIDGEQAILTLNTVEGKFPVSEFDGVLNMEPDPLMYGTKTSETDTGRLEVRAVPGSPGGVYRDAPDIFARRLEIGQFVPADHGETDVPGVDITTLPDACR